MASISKCQLSASTSKLTVSGLAVWSHFDLIVLCHHFAVTCLSLFFVSAIASTPNNSGCFLNTNVKVFKLIQYFFCWWTMVDMTRHQFGDITKRHAWQGNDVQYYRLQFINISWLGFIYLIVQLWKQVLLSSSAASTNAATLPMLTDWGTKTICLRRQWLPINVDSTQCSTKRGRIERDKQLYQYAWKSTWLTGVCIFRHFLGLCEHQQLCCCPYNTGKHQLYWKCAQHPYSICVCGVIAFESNNKHSPCRFSPVSKRQQPRPF